MSRNQLTGVVVVMLTAAAVWYILPKPCPPLPDNIAALRKEALRLQQDDDLVAAQIKWEEFRSHLQAGECFDGERSVANKNLKVIDERMGLPDDLNKKPIRTDPEPSRIEAKDAAEFYQVGRRIRSVATLAVTGEGVFRDYGFKSSRYFAYIHRVPLDTLVTENQNGSRVVFEQRIGDFVELLAVSKDKLELDLPGSPILDAIAGEFDNRATRYSWRYRFIRDIAVVLQKLDPNLERTLSAFQKILLQNGVPLGNSADVTYIAMVKELAGTRVSVEYVVGPGITEVKVLDGKKFSNGTVQRFAYDANVAADCALAKDLEVAQDQLFKVQADQLAPLLSLNALFGLEMQAMGELELVKRRDDQPADQAVERFDIVGGRVDLRDRDGTAGISGALTPKPGSYLKYDRNKHLVIEAEAKWEIVAQSKSKDHLVFEAESLQGIQAKSNYRGALLSD